MNEFSMNGQFSEIEEFEEYFMKIFKDILDIIQEKNMVLYKLPRILEQPLIEEQTLGNILLCSRNRAAMAVLKSKIIQILDNPYLDETTCMTKSGSSYEYPDKSEEPNCFTEAIERKCPLISFKNEHYCQREFLCEKDGQEILLRNIRNQSDLLEVYLEKEPMDVRYVIERYPFIRQIVLA